MKPEERFWEKVKKSDGCWEWTASDNGNGYGVFGVSGRTTYAHRFSFELHHGSIPDGMYVLHKCDNRRCVRPDHLFSGTQRENVHDMIAKGRRRSYDRRGARNPNLKLSAGQVSLARELRASGHTLASIAARLGVGTSQIHRISTSKQRTTG